MYVPLLVETYVVRIHLRSVCRAQPPNKRPLVVSTSGPTVKTGTTLSSHNRRYGDTYSSGVSVTARLYLSYAGMSERVKVSTCLHPS